MSLPNGRVRILHLEDNPRDSELIHELLASDGLEAEFVRVAGRQDFEAAVRREAFDAVLTDYSVPDYDGMSALRFAKSIDATVPVIVISGSLGEEAAVQCLKHGATDYLLKDRLDRLGPALRRALHEAKEERQRRLAEAALRESEERFRQLAETIDDVFWNTTPDCQTINYVSPAFERVWGRTLAELRQKPTLWIDCIRAADRPRVLEALKRLARGEDFEIEYRIGSTGNGARWILDRRFPLRDAEGKVYRTVGVARDITERKELEAQLRRAQRVESVGLLASGIAHDMNNILAPIMMSAPLLRMSLSAAEAENVLSGIEVSAQRGAALVRQLLILSRGVEGERRAVSPAVIISDIIKIFAETFPRNIAIHTRVPDSVWSVHGDATQLHQVVLNLCVNARDAMPDGGALTVSVKNTEVDEQYVSLNPDAKPGRYVLIRVEDTGVGVAPEIMDRIFDPFFTTKEVGKGTGLGLATVLGIVKGHGGFVRLQSESGRGTTFEIFLPASDAIEQSPAGGARAEAPRGHEELILIVDDEENIRAVLRDTLVRHNYKVVSASNGVEATALFAANPGIKLVLTDLDMPLMDGVSLGRVLRRLNGAVKIVVSTGLTGRSGVDKRQQELNALEINAVLTKPYTAEKLLQVVHDTLDGEPALVKL
jgi:PAS domain S-box-containing protein